MMTRWENWRSTLISSPAANCCELPSPSGRQTFSSPCILKLCPFVPFLVAPTLMTPSKDLSFDSVSDKEAERWRWMGGWKIQTDEWGKEGCEAHGLLRGSAGKACPQERKEEELREVKMREKRGGKSKIKKRGWAENEGSTFIIISLFPDKPATFLMTPVRVCVYLGLISVAGK